MSPKDLFRIILKIIALIVAFNSVVPLLLNVYNIGFNEMYAIFMTIGLTLFYLAFIYFIMIKVDLIIKWLKLDSGFDSEVFNIGNISFKKTIDISIIILGLYLSLSSLPTLLQEVFLLFKSKVSYNLLNSVDFQNDYYLYNSIIQFFVGLIIVASRKLIINLFTSKTK